MFRKVFSFLVLVLLFPGLIWCVTFEINEIEESCKSTYNFYSFNHLSSEAAGRGYTGIAAAGNLSMALLNPAAVELNESWQLYTEVNDKPEVNFSLSDHDFGIENYRTGSLYGIGLKRNQFQIGLLYYVRNSYDLQTCQECYYNGALVDSLQYHLRYMNTVTSIPITFSYKNLLKLGVNLQMEKHESGEPIAMVGQGGINEVITGRVYEKVYRYQVGLVAEPISGLAVGATFRPQATRRVEKNFGDFYGTARFRDSTFPLSIGAGIRYDASFLPVSVFFDYNYSRDSVYDELVDRNDYNAGLEFNYHQLVFLRAGFFTQKDYRDFDYTISHEGQEYNYWSNETSLEQNFLTFGAGYRFHQLKLDLSVIDSSLLEAGDIKLTQVNLGVGLDL
ncbi:MAG: hypothetical protein JW784_04680 [Candidatus Cloacimonetes bacterium]|nr:hypothetical protein [Candidatus Cloacimonadota bacterium]